MAGCAGSPKSKAFLVATAQRVTKSTNEWGNTMKTANSLGLVLATVTMLAFTSSASAVTILKCIETIGGRSPLAVKIKDENNRLTASVYETAGRDRLVFKAGVAERRADGRNLDVIYIGRDIKLSVSSDTLEGILELKQGRNVRKTRVDCSE